MLGSLQVVMPKKHEFGYVTLSEPHTGLRISIHTSEQIGPPLPASEVSVDPGHSPSETLVTAPPLTHCATSRRQSLEYVSPFEPQTGLKMAGHASLHSVEEHSPSCTWVISLDESLQAARLKWHVFE
jgi:hypothetical protein